MSSYWLNMKAFSEKTFQNTFQNLLTWPFDAYTVKHKISNIFTTFLLWKQSNTSLRPLKEPWFSFRSQTKNWYKLNHAADFFQLFCYYFVKTYFQKIFVVLFLMADLTSRSISIYVLSTFFHFTFIYLWFNNFRLSSTNSVWNLTTQPQVFS